VLMIAGDIGESKKVTKQVTQQVDQLASNRLLRRLGELRQHLPGETG